jgi:hypothetical protein
MNKKKYIDCGYVTYLRFYCESNLIFNYIRNKTRQLIFLYIIVIMDTQRSLYWNDAISKQINLRISKLEITI